ncbi:MAG: transposase [Bacteroidaceae bacterium]|nr:transposase [Bacteroidaceae bacterium]
MRHHRENGWDYKGRAIYHFTLPVEERFPLFGTLEGERAETAFVRLNPFGRRVCQMLCGLAQFYAGKGFALKVLAQKVMPDHVHLVIQVLEPLPQSIGAVVRGFKSGCTKVYKEMYGSGENAAGVHGNGEENAAGVHGNGEENAAGVHGNGEENAAGVHGNGEDRHERAAEAPVHFARIFARRGSIWQQDAAYYHERILHAPGQLRRMIDYVKDNPRRLWIKSHNPELFRLHRRTEAAGLSFTSMGNHFLLDWPDKQVVEMSRSATNDEVQERLRKVLAAAHNGTVTYTAAISKGEQIIARTLREQGYPLVVLLNDGFPKEGAPHERYYKPGGVYFEACSKGQLLLLEPIEQTFLDDGIQAAVEETLRRKAEARHYTYTPIPVTSQRYRFVALNEMAKRLAQNME